MMTSGTIKFRQLRELEDQASAAAWRPATTGKVEAGLGDGRTTNGEVEHPQFLAQALAEVVCRRGRVRGHGRGGFVRAGRAADPAARRAPCQRAEKTPRAGEGPGAARGARRADEEGRGRA